MTSIIHNLNVIRKHLAHLRASECQIIEIMTLIEDVCRAARDDAWSELEAGEQKYSDGYECGREEGEDERERLEAERDAAKAETARIRSALQGLVGALDSHFSSANEAPGSAMGIARAALASSSGERS